MMRTHRKKWRASGSSTECWLLFLIALCSCDFCLRTRSSVTLFYVGGVGNETNLIARFKRLDGIFGRDKAHLPHEDQKSSVESRVGSGKSEVMAIPNQHPLIPWPHFEKFNAKPFAGNNGSDRSVRHQNPFGKSYGDGAL